MRCLTSNENSLHLKHVRQGQKPERKLTQVNTIQYDMKSHQVKMTIENCTDLRLKGLKISTTNRRDVGIANKYVTQLENFNGT